VVVHSQEAVDQNYRFHYYQFELFHLLRFIRIYDLRHSTFLLKLNYESTFPKHKYLLIYLLVLFFKNNLLIILIFDCFS
jgi:hypothetical protein